LYDGTDNASAQFANEISGAGYSYLHVVTGRFDAWKAAGVSGSGDFKITPR